MLVLKKERPRPGLEGMDGIDPTVFRQAGLIRNGRLDMDGANSLLSHLREDHGWEPEYEPDGARIRPLSTDQQGQFPYATHYAPKGLADFLRVHARLHASWGHDPDEALR